MQPIRSRQMGFTLIELMIAVAIVGILAAIAYPAYQDSVRKSWRANAVSCLSEMAQAMERRYTTSFSYEGALPVAACTNEGSMPQRYTFSFTAAPTATVFTLQAVPVAGGPQASDNCGTLTLNQAGTKGSGGDVGTCWRR